MGAVYPELRCLDSASSIMFLAKEAKTTSRLIVSSRQERTLLRPLFRRAASNRTVLAHLNRSFRGKDNGD